MMNDQQLLRYSRQIMLADIDIEGQQTLLDSTVLVLGVGGLGSPVVMYLAAAGVGKLIVVDDDEVDLTNLQRQIVHKTASIGASKVESAKKTVHELNPECDVEAIHGRLNEEQLNELLSKADLAVDCTDNFGSRFLLNRLTVDQKIPLISGAAIRMEGQISVFDPRDSESPCYQCLYKEGEDETLTCSESGVLSPVVGIIGSMQALEAIKALTQTGQTLQGRLMLFDAKYSEWRTLKLRKDPACPVCSAT